MSYQTIYNPYTGQLQRIDLSQPDAQQQLVSYYKKGWGAATAVQAQQAQQAQPAQQIQRQAQPKPAPYTWKPPDIAKLKTGLKEKTVTISKVSPVTTPPPPFVPAPAARKPQPSTPSTSPLQTYIKDGQVNLVEIARARDQAALAAARQEWGDRQVDKAIYIAKTPVTQEQWDRLGSGTQKNARIVKPLPVEAYNRIPDHSKHKFYIEATPVKADVAAALGPGVLGRTAYYSPSVWESYTPWAEEKGGKATTANSLLWYADTVVLGVSTVRHWNEMSIPEKVASVALDLLILGSFARPIFRGAIGALRPRFRTPKEVKVLIDTANDAGSAHARLVQARIALSDAERLRFKVPGVSESQLRHNVQLAANQSRAADMKFIRQLSSTRELTTTDVRKIERISQLPGLRRALDKVNRYQDQLAKQWKSLARWEREYGFTPRKFDPNIVKADLATQGKFHIYRQKLTAIQNTRAKLDKALVQYGETVRPRVKHTPAPEFQGYQMQWSDAFGGKGGINPLLDDYDALLKRSSDWLDKQRLSEAVRAKETRVFTLEKPAVASEGQYSLRLSPQFSEAVESSVADLVAPKVKRARITLPELPEIAKLTPAMISQATPAVIAQFYALKVVSATMGKPIADIDTQAELKTAHEINAQYQAALLAGVEAATKAYKSTMAATDDATKARVNAEAAAKIAIEGAVQTQPKTKVQIAVQAKAKVQVRIKAFRAAKTIIRGFLRGRPDDEGLHIEEVEGIPSNPGVISYNMGIVEVGIHPPYRPGTEDITFVRLEKTQTGRGSEQQTLSVRKGKAPKKIVLRHGQKRTEIRGGRHLESSMLRRSGRGPGLLTSSGRMVRQRRGRLLK